MQEKAYALDMNMEEKHFKKFYTMLDTYVIFVVAEPIKIIFPSIIRVPRGGCSIPEII